MFKIVLTENESMIFGAKIQISLNLNIFEFSHQNSQNCSFANFKAEFE